MAGSVFTKAGLTNYLQSEDRSVEGVSTWSSLYGQVDAVKQAQQAQLFKNFATETAEAYKENAASVANVEASNLGSGYKAQAVDYLDDALNKAYETYISNYQQGMSEINEYNEELRSGITSAIESQAQYMMDYEQAHYDYLRALYDKQVESGGTLFDEDPIWSKYRNVLTDEKGNESYGEILSDAELRNKFYDAETGALTKEGTEFYKTIENASIDTGYSFQDYLREKATESEDAQALLDWATQNYSMDFAPGISGDTTGETRFKKAVGIGSGDISWGEETPVKKDYIKQLLPSTNKYFEDDLSTLGVNRKKIEEDIKKNRLNKLLSSTSAKDKDDLLNKATIEELAGLENTNSTKSDEATDEATIEEILKKDRTALEKLLIRKRIENLLKSF